ERIGDTQLALGQVEQALGSYQQALNAGRPLVPELLLREKVAQLYLGSGANRVDDAVAQYDAILAVAQNPGYRSSIELLAAQALLSNGNTVDGLPRVRQIFDNYPGTGSAFQAMQILIQNSITIDAYARGKAYYNAEAYTEAIDAFNEFSSTNTLENIPAEFYLLLGRAYRVIGNSQAAQVTFQTLIEQYPGDPLLGDALLEQGRTRFLAGDIPDAINTYLGVANTYGYLNDAASEAIWRAGYLYSVELNDAALSRQTFIDLADKYPTSEWALNGLLLAASSALTSDNYTLAEQLYGRIAGLAAGEERAAAYFNLGKLAQRNGNQQAATDAYSLAIQAAPDSYYAARSADVQVNRAPFQPPVTYKFDFDEVALKAEAEAWIRSTYSITVTGDLAQPSVTLLADPRLIRGQELWELAAYNDAIDEFDSITDEARDAGDMLTLYQLAVMFRDEGKFYSSVIAAADVIRPSGVPTVDAPAYLAQMRYPAAYIEVIQDVIGEDNVDPLLMLSLMRHESLFNTYATAAAGEKGLTQVIPGTAQYIADELAWENYQHSDLFRPYAGISFGVFYLDEQLGRFGGSAIPALAAYNAGPGRAIAWNDLSGGDPDAFMTAIQIDSTRLYVQRIYSYHSIYRVLYGA
ncbi:MAG: transglycosylase SLT domain-containing protein, partial [Aggregatilineales bacterium]